MKILGLWFVLLFSACITPSFESDAPLSCPTEEPRTGDSCRSYGDGYQCGRCVCGASGWVCPGANPSADLGCGRPPVCPARDPQSGEACGALPDGWQCGPCVCTGRTWSCGGRTDGGGQTSCPTGGVRTGGSCSQFETGYQCGKCVCSDAQQWACY